MIAVDTAEGAATVLKLEVGQPSLCAVALVLDLSDSCATMQAEISRLPRLLEALPRGWPVWIYRLSDALPLHASATVAHLCDGSLDLMRWTSDRRVAEKGQATGSYLRPPLEAIIARASEEQIPRTRVLILTDGELLDSSPFDMPTDVDVIGLTAKLEAGCQAQWTRVLRSSRLCLLSDPALDHYFRPPDGEFYGNCQVHLQGLLSLGPILQLAPRGGSSSVVDKPTLTWNFTDGPLLLHVAAAQEAIVSEDLAVESLLTGNSVGLLLKDASNFGISTDEAMAFSRGAPSKAQLLYIINDLDSEFSLAWNAARAAAALARDRTAWVDNDGCLRAFNDAIFCDRLWSDERNVVADCWLCLLSTEPVPQPPPGAQIAIFALSRDHRPALQWNAGEILTFGSVSQSIRIAFDVMEARWTVAFGNSEPRELNPRGSEEFAIVIEEHGVSTTWKALFSGVLR